MNVSDDLTALVFELQRAQTPADKARALARAWRTIRGLSAAERRLLVREVGFDGAEELVEGLAGKSGGVFAPAALLEALGKMRKNGGLSLRGVLTGLRDPETREDLLTGGIDLVADSFDPEEEVVAAVLEMEEPDVDGIPAAQPIAGAGHRDADSKRAEVDEIQAAPTDEPVAPDPELPELPPPPSEMEPPPTPDINPKPEPPPRAKETSAWDDPWQSSPVSETAEAPAPRRDRTFGESEAGDQQQSTGSVLDRMRALRAATAALRKAGPREIMNHLETLPELWARRRALVELIDAGIPESADEVLDLIVDLERAMDRRWCLAALARRGDLEGDGLERALGMLASPAAKRRVEALAGRCR